MLQMYINRHLIWNNFEFYVFSVKYPSKHQYVGPTWAMGVPSGDGLTMGIQSGTHLG